MNQTINEIPSDLPMDDSKKAQADEWQENQEPTIFDKLNKLNKRSCRDL
jgi:hypothetical protein